MENCKLKIGVLFLCLVGLCINAQAQDSKIDIEARIGLNSSTLWGNSIVKEHRKIMFNPTGFVGINYYITSAISLQTGLSWKSEGWANRTPITNELGEELYHAKTKVNYNYLSIPILIRPVFGEKQIFNVFVGPSFDFLVNETMVYKDPNIEKERIKVNSGIKKFNVALVSGIGIQYPISEKIKFVTNLSTNLGLLNIYNGGKLKTFSYALTVGTTISIK